MGVTTKGPQRKIRGIRDSIPAGYVLGRLSPGEGDAELIHLSELGNQLTLAVNGGGGGAGGGGVASASSVQRVAAQAAGTNSTVQTIIIQAANGSFGASPLFVIQKDVGDETTAITTGTGKKTFRIPGYVSLSEVRASLTTAQATGSTFTVDLKKNGSTVFAVPLTIDNTKKTSLTAAAPAVLSVTTLTDDDEMRIDVTQVGDGTATGLKVTLFGLDVAGSFIPSLDFSDSRNSQYLGVV